MAPAPPTLSGAAPWQPLSLWHWLSDTVCMCAFRRFVCENWIFPVGLIEYVLILLCNASKVNLLRSIQALTNLKYIFKDRHRKRHAIGVIQFNSKPLFIQVKSHWDQWSLFQGRPAIFSRETCYFLPVFANKQPFGMWFKNWYLTGEEIYKDINYIKMKKSYSEWRIKVTCVSLWCTYYKKHTYFRTIFPETVVITYKMAVIFQGQSTTHWIVIKD